MFLMIGVILTTRAVLVRPTWVRTYESEDKDLWCWAVALDGQRVVAFGSDWIGGLDGKLGWLLRVYDQKGTLLWSRTHTRWGIAGDARAAGVALDSDGCIYCATHEQVDDSVVEFRVTKFGADGEEMWQWHHVPPLPTEESDFSVASDGHGGCVVAGTERWGKDERATRGFVARVNPSGGTKWLRSITGRAGELAGCGYVSVDGGGDVLALGYGVPRGVGTHSYWRLDKIGGDGLPHWSRTYAGIGRLAAVEAGVAADSANCALVVGAECVGERSQGLAWVIRKYDSSGVFLWQRTYHSGIGNDDVAWSVALDGAGSILVGGYVNRIADRRKAAWQVVRYDAQGSQSWRYSYKGSGKVACEVRGIAADKAGNFVVAGTERVVSDGRAHQRWRIAYFKRP